MANDINSVVLIGRLTKAPELKYTAGGSPVCNFSIANNRSYSSGGERKEYVSFFNCIAWNKLGEAIAKYCHKGHRVGIRGRLQQRTWEGSTGTTHSMVEVIVEEFEFLERKKADAPPAEEPPLMGEDVSGSVPSFDDALPIEPGF